MEKLSEVSTEAGSARKPGRWTLPALCLVVMLAAWCVWMYQHVWATEVLRKAETERRLDCHWSEVPGALWRRAPGPGDYPPGTMVRRASLHGGREEMPALVAALRHFSGLGILDVAGDDPYAPRQDDGRAGALLAALRPDDEVRELGFYDEGIDELMLAGLGRLQSLVSLSIYRTVEGVTGEELPVLPRLAGLSLGSGHVTDAGLAHLLALPAIQYVDVWGTEITLAGIEQALKTASPTLRSLEVRAGRVTPEERTAVDALIARQPAGRKLVVHPR